MRAISQRSVLRHSHQYMNYPWCDHSVVATTGGKRATRKNAADEGGPISSLRAPEKERYFFSAVLDNELSDVGSTPVALLQGGFGGWGSRGSGKQALLM